jgi:hypothetical protein
MTDDMQCHGCGRRLSGDDAAFRDTTCECGAKNFVDVATVPAPSSYPHCDCEMVKTDDGSLACRWCEPRRSRVRPAVPIVGTADIEGEGSLGSIVAGVGKRTILRTVFTAIGAAAAVIVAGVSGLAGALTKPQSLRPTPQTKEPNSND